MFPQPTRKCWSCCLVYMTVVGSLTEKLNVSDSIHNIIDDLPIISIAGI